MTGWVAGLLFKANLSLRVGMSKRYQKARRTFISLVALVVLSSGLTDSPAAAQGGLVPVTVTILHWQELDDIDDEFGEREYGDPYAVVKIDGNEGRTPVQDHHANIGLFPRPTGMLAFTQSVTLEVDPADEAAPVRIELWDHDRGLLNNDDRYNISPDEGDPGLDLILDVAAGTWSGPNGTNSGFTEGVRGDRASVWFDIALGETGDIDGDGIPDGVERFGIRGFDGGVDLDLGAMGAHPCRKTIVVEVDWFELTGDHTHDPGSFFFEELVDAFANAPVAPVADCPYTGLVSGSDTPVPLAAPTSGVDLIVDRDSTIAFTSKAAEAAPVDVSTTTPNLETYAERRLSAVRRPYVHYNLWAHNHPKGFAGQCCGDGDEDGLHDGDFLVARGDPTTTSVGRRNQKGTFMHELGHALSLLHGGADPPGDDQDPFGINYKPNYRSVMNYSFSSLGVPQFPFTARINSASSLVIWSRLDYSRRELAELSERELVEADGIDQSVQAPSGFAPMTFWWNVAGDAVAADVRDPIDWNQDGDTKDVVKLSDVKLLDINRDRVCVGPGPDRKLQTEPATGDATQTLQPFVDNSLDAVVTGEDRDCDTTKKAGSDDQQVQKKGFKQPDTLGGHDDWSSLCYRALLADADCTTGDSGSELTLQQEQQLQDALVAGVIEFLNEPPAAEAGGPYVVNEGSTVILDGNASSDPDNDLMTFSWNPATHLDAATTAMPTYRGVDDTVDTLTLTVTDPDGLTDSDMTTVTVLNVAPNVTATGDFIEEAETATVAATFTDPGVSDTHTARINWGDGTALEPVAVNQRLGSGSLSGSHVYGDNGTYLVTVMVIDDDSGVGTGSTAVVVSNRVPDVTLTTTGIVSFPGGDVFVGRIGVSQEHEASATDPGSDDLTFTWDFGPVATYFNDGTRPDPLPSPGGTFPFTANDAATVTLGIPGLELIQVTTNDDDGGSDTDSTAKLFTGDTNRTYGSGYWKHQYRGNGKLQVDEATLEGYLEIVDFVSRVFSEQTTATTSTAAAAVLSPGGGDKGAVATADLFVAWLHFASGAVSSDATVPIKGLQVPYLEVMNEIEAIVLDPIATRAELLHASFLAQLAMHAS